MTTAMTFKRPVAVLVLAATLASIIPAASWAESLAGQVGDRRYAPQFGNTKGPCGKAYKDYVAASGHSAYAQTHAGMYTEAFFCGRAYNAPSQKEAERRALANCNAVFKKHKVQTTGRCTIYASK